MLLQALLKNTEKKTGGKETRRRKQAKRSPTWEAKEKAAFLFVSFSFERSFFLMLRYRTTLTHRRLLWLPVKKTTTTTTAAQWSACFTFFFWNEKTKEKKKGGEKKRTTLRKQRRKKRDDKPCCCQVEARMCGGDVGHVKEQKMLRRIHPVSG